MAFLDPELEHCYVVSTVQQQFLVDESQWLVAVLPQEQMMMCVGFVRRQKTVCQCVV